jgi:epoxide hydrolase 4
VAQGQEDGPLVVLLHGFPEFWYSWRYQLPALAAAGFRAVAVDQRGYNLSDKPHGLEAYRVSRLARDVDAVRQALGAERMCLVGHDWGGAVAWTYAMRYPERLTRLVILNAPHPAVFLKHIRRPAQLRKSWYMFFFQLPRLPEAALRAGKFAFIRRELRDPEYVAALAQPGALTATINYYRAMFRRPRGIPLRKWPRIEAPVLVIWGQRDRFLGPELAAPDEHLVPNVRLERLPTSHWVQLEAPERVNELLVDFLRAT